MRSSHSLLLAAFGCFCGRFSDSKGTASAVRLFGADTHDTQKVDGNSVSSRQDLYARMTIANAFFQEWRDGTNVVESEGVQKMDTKNAESNVTTTTRWSIIAVCVLLVAGACGMRFKDSISNTVSWSLLGSLALCISYIVVSSGLIAFNKFLMDEARFPYAVALTALHMTMTSVLSVTFFFLAPSWYPTAEIALGENLLYVMKSLVPISLLFSASLYMSNEAYHYCSIAFLQFIKETNLAVVYIISCLAGLLRLEGSKVMLVVWIFCGCTCCVRGELHFSSYGFALQAMALLCECSKNVIVEIALKGKGLSLDPLTFTLIQAPLTLVPLGIALAITRPTGIVEAFCAYWHLLIINSMIAFVLNVMLAVVIKRLSAVHFVLVGITKDVCIVSASAIVFGDTVTYLQVVGVILAMSGVFGWSRLKIQSSGDAGKQGEKTYSK
eukprot:TRINITY_DN4729_c0_g2_i2.p1 TRINITY_DN4729_c0_g2~~TRINITY_DN4729_c0_g2_i2.p1  ORF type:complete len:440 (-),score=32.84 TRINITY_DN4729_c0_g2_i2:38-1357(-)